MTTAEDRLLPSDEWRLAVLLHDAECHDDRCSSTVIASVYLPRVRRLGHRGPLPPPNRLLAYTDDETPPEPLV